MATFKQVCRAIFVLPLTAGNLIWKNRQQFSHDGSISGLLMLTTLVTLVAEMTYIFKSARYEKEHLTKPFLIILNGLGIMTCTAVVAIERSRSRLLPSPHTINLALKLKFLYLFCFGCLIYRIFQVITHIRCKEFMYEYVRFVQKIILESVALLFNLVQAAFVSYFAGRQLKSSLYIFYSFVIISVANISDWTHHEAAEHGNTSKQYDVCVYNNSDYVERDLFETIKPFIEPTLLEYPLLCMIFLSEMWPNREQSNHNTATNQLIYGPDLSKQVIWSIQTEDELSGISSHNMRNMEDCSDFDRNYENMPLHPQLHRNSSGQACNLRAFCVLTFSVLFSSPRIIIELLQIFGILNEYFIISSVVTIIEHIVMVIAIIMCFYALESQCRPSKGHNSYDITSVLLIISFLVSNCVYTLHLMMHIFPEKYLSYKTGIHITKELATILELYFQTVYILQMRKYRILNSSIGLFSVRNVCLFLAFTNLSLWFSDTFLLAQFIYTFNDPDLVEIKTFNRFSFPFVMFYRFECFMSLYSLYKA